MRGIKKRRDTSNGQQGCSRIIWYKPNEELAARDKEVSFVCLAWQLHPKTQRDHSRTEEQNETFNWDRIEEMVADLTERIEAMGPVNLDAIQEYDELEQRQIYHEKEDVDSPNPKAELHAVIAKINRTTKELFADTFAKIRENFQDIFAELFGSGRANLSSEPERSA